MFVFKSSSSHFITTIYSMEYESEGTSRGQVEETSSTSNVPSSVLSMSQVCTELGVEQAKMKQLIDMVKHPALAADLMQALGETNRTRFKKNYLNPLIEMGVIKMTQPDSPKSPTQRYVLTEEGKKLLE